MQKNVLEKMALGKSGCKNTPLQEWPFSILSLRPGEGPA